jgi:hypothetical protein
MKEIFFLNQAKIEMQNIITQPTQKINFKYKVCEHKTHTLRKLKHIK